jgi:hypothetical protein
MSDSRKDYKVGYQRPPKAPQWKPGQSGNRRGGSSRRPISIVEMIDKLLLAMVTITIKNEPRRVTVLEAILHQLFIKGLAGNHRAIAVYLRWMDLIPRVAFDEIEIRFANSDDSNTSTVQASMGNPVDE